MSYETKPGSVPARAIAHLETLDKGAEVATAALATAINYPNAGSLTAVLQDARNAGAVFCRQKGGHPKSPLFWSLLDHGAASHANRATPPKPAPVLAKALPEGRDSQQVLKAEAATPDATDRETTAMQSPRVGAMGAGQPADAGPAVRCIALTVEVATIHQAERVMQLVREMAGEGA